MTAATVTDPFRFEIACTMMPHGWDENGLNWDDGNLAYYKLSTVVRRWRDSLTFTAMAFQNTNFSTNYWGARF